MRLCREIALHAALKERRRALAQKGSCIYTAYVLCCGRFKPGAKERLEREMASLAARIERIERRLSRWKR